MKDLLVSYLPAKLMEDGNILFEVLFKFLLTACMCHIHLENLLILHNWEVVYYGLIRVNHNAELVLVQRE